MALTKVTNPPDTPTLDVHWTELVNKLTKSHRAKGEGFAEFYISARTTSDRPSVWQGSIVEVGGSLYEATTNEAFIDDPGLVDGVVHVKLVPQGVTQVNAVLTSEALPSWDPIQGGWYNAQGERFLNFYMVKSGSNFSNKGYYTNLTASQITFYTGAMTMNGGITSGGNLSVTGTITSTGAITGGAGSFNGGTHNGNLVNGLTLVNNQVNQVTFAGAGQISASGTASLLGAVRMQRNVEQTVNIGAGATNLFAVGVYTVLCTSTIHLERLSPNLSTWVPMFSFNGTAEYRTAICPAIGQLRLRNSSGSTLTARFQVH